MQQPLHARLLATDRRALLDRERRLAPEYQLLLVLRLPVRCLYAEQPEPVTSPDNRLQQPFGDLPHSVGVVGGGRERPFRRAARLLRELSAA